METPFQELIKTLQSGGGFQSTSNIEWSVKIWIRHPEGINSARKRLGGITEEAEQALQLVEAYNEPHESEIIQRLSEDYRQRFILK